jgi:hypothetical protein
VSDARTREYTGGAVARTPIAISIGDRIHTHGGQAALLASVNAAVRNHPAVYVRASDVPLLGPARGGTTHNLLAHLETATPTAQLQIVDALPHDVTLLGIGRDINGADLYIGADRFTGKIAADPLDISADASSAWGAGLAAMLAANHLFRTAIALPVPSFATLSLWTMAESGGSSGPADLGPIDVGTTWLIGAGGVGSSIAWWLSLLGVYGRWTVIDHERVELTNLNRSLGMFLGDYGAGGDSASFKAHVAAELMGATPFPDDWDAWVVADPSPPDVLIAAANDRGVRASLAAYSHPMALTGTTSRRWTAELHLYRAGVDGCIDCRHPSEMTADFACSTSAVPTGDGGHADAALSFLSGTAGLLALAGLARLQAGELVDVMNHWQLFFQPARRPITPNRQTCSRGCRRTLDERSRYELFGDTRWTRPADD